MKTTMGLLCTSLLLACGGGKEAAEPAPVAEPVAAAELPPEATGGDTAPAEAVAPAAAETPPAPEPVAATPVRATADLKAFKGDASLGTVTFEVAEGKVNVNGQFSGLKPGPHALYIHEKGDCGKNGKAAGKHFDPTKAKHGGLGDTVRHAGDFGDVVADETGAATIAVPTDSITVEPADAATSVVGKAVVIYTNKDSKSGKAGAALGCGVITLPESGSAPAERQQ